MFKASEAKASLLNWDIHDAGLEKMFSNSTVPIKDVRKCRIIDELWSVPLAWACSSCFISDPTSLCLVRSLIFYSMLSPRPNLTLFS
ncbi:hypothetical protein E4T56_gene18794 [Termitomyces sp. T112]|nr:hypothetical protein E4T56_gene18794 [Termitomyces sp. T112]